MSCSRSAFVYYLDYEKLGVKSFWWVGQTGEKNAVLIWGVVINFNREALKKLSGLKK